MMTIYAIADTHGYLPIIPECRLLLLGGDYCPTRDLEQQKRYMDGTFRNWLEQIPAKYIVGIAGNHDMILQSDPEFARSLPWKYLCDEEINIETVKIYGTPWTHNFGTGWAFQGTNKELEGHFTKIPKGLDILLSHGPASRHLDEVRDGSYLIHAGSFALYDRIQDIRPDSMVFGHIHGSRGIKEVDGTRYYNCTQMNTKHEPCFNAMTIELRVK